MVPSIFDLKKGDVQFHRLLDPSMNPSNIQIVDEAVEESPSEDNSKVLTPPVATVRTKKETQRLIDQYAVASYPDNETSFQKNNHQDKDKLNRFDRE